MLYCHMYIYTHTHTHKHTHNTHTDTKGELLAKDWSWLKCPALTCPSLIKERAVIALVQWLCVCVCVYCVCVYMLARQLESLWEPPPPLVLQSEVNQSCPKMSASAQAILYGNKWQMGMVVLCLISSTKCGFISYKMKPSVPQKGVKVQAADTQGGETEDMLSEKC